MAPCTEYRMRQGCDNDGTGTVPWRAHTRLASILFGSIDVPTLHAVPCGCAPLIQGGSHWTNKKNTEKVIRHHMAKSQIIQQYIHLRFVTGGPFTRSRCLLNKCLGLATGGWQLTAGPKDCPQGVAQTYVRPSHLYHVLWAVFGFFFGRSVIPQGRGMGQQTHDHLTVLWREVAVWVTIALDMGTDVV